MKKTFVLTLAILVSSCGSVTSYDYPSFSDEAGKYSKGVEVSQKEYTTTFLTTYLSIIKVSSEPFDNIQSKLLDENPDYDLVINPKIKSKTIKIIPFVYWQKMERITTRLGKYHY
jgi:uncharacterized protein YceK